MSTEENIMVVPRELFDALGAFNGVCHASQPYLDAMLAPQANRFMPRSLAENDPSFKQIIPYAVFMHEGKILHYVRGKSSGEKRLVAKGSIGIGGHVNDSDRASFDAETYYRAVRREIAEELAIADSWSERVVALINDDSNEVGRVHLGVVHLVTLTSDRVTAAESTIVELEFLSLDELRARVETLESWSQILVDSSLF